MSHTRISFFAGQSFATQPAMPRLGHGAGNEGPPFLALVSTWKACFVMTMTVSARTEATAVKSQQGYCNSAAWPGGQAGNDRHTASVVTWQLIAKQPQLKGGALQVAQLLS